MSSVTEAMFFLCSRTKNVENDFANPLLIAHLQLKEIFDKPQIKIHEKTTLKSFHQQ